nr:uncharacterized protein LOC112012624 isoform X2 [Quercus suber]
MKNETGGVPFHREAMTTKMKLGFRRDCKLNLGVRRVLFPICFSHLENNSNKLGVLLLRSMLRKSRILICRSLPIGSSFGCLRQLTMMWCFRIFSISFTTLSIRRNHHHHPSHLLRNSSTRSILYRKRSRSNWRELRKPPLFRLGINCGAQSEGNASKFGSTICHEFNSFVTLHSSQNVPILWFLLTFQS